MSIRRKFLAALLSLFIGGIFGIYSSKSHAFLDRLISPSTLFKWFLEAAGGVMFRFLGNRFLSNIESAFDDFTKKQQQSDTAYQAQLSQSFTVGHQSIINTLQSIYDESVKREITTIPSACLYDSMSIQTQEITLDNSSFESISKRLKEFLMDTHSLRNSSNTGFFSLSTKTLINENGQLELKEIHKLVQEGDIFDIRKAEQEIVLLISDLIPSNSLSLIEKRKLEEVGYQVKLSILLDAFSRLLSDKAAIYNFPDSSMDHLSDEIREQYQGKKLSKSSLLKLETEAISMNGKLLDQLNDSASVSSLISFLNRSQALETKLLYELYQISELRNQVASLRLMRSI